MSNNGKVLVIDNNPKFVNYQVPKNFVKEADNAMENKDFVTKDNLKSFEEKIDLKIKVAVQPLEGKIDNLQTNMNGKFDTLEQKIENMFLKQKEEIQNERKENTKWIVGTAIALVAAVAAIVAIF